MRLTILVALLLAAGPACDEDTTGGSADGTVADQKIQLDLPLPDKGRPDFPATPDLPSKPDATVGPDLAPDTLAPDTGPPGPKVIGCSDGTRGGFLDHIKFPRLAACQGAWTVKGAHNTTAACKRASGNDGKNPKGTGCNVTDLCASGWHVCFGKVDVLSRNPTGCLNIMDGVKTGPAFYLARTSSTGAFDCSQDSTKFGGPGTSDDLFGCGNLGCQMVQGKCTTGSLNCDPLKKCSTCPAGQSCLNKSVCKPEKCYPLTTASHNLYKCLRNDKGCGSWCNHLGKYPSLKNTWSCDDKSSIASKNEANAILKVDPNSQGGVLCCED